MQFRLLGPVAAVKAGERIELGGPKRALLLAALLLRANRTCSTDYLIDVLWEGDPPPGARATLHSHVAHLRRHIGSDVLLSQGSGYELRVAPDMIDAASFERLLATARSALAGGSCHEALEAVDAALGLWQGSALEGLSERSFAAPEAARLEQLRLDAVELRLHALAALGRHAEVAADAERALTTEPWRESLWALLATALYRAGRQADALGALRRARALLLDQLGVDPSPALGELEERILRQDPALAAPAVQEPPAPPRQRLPDPGLPVPLTTFVGRDVERRELADLLGRHRLVTVAGPGGAGKTRLAITGAADVADRYPDGACFVDLVPVTDVTRVGAAVAARLGVGEQQGLPVDDALTAALDGRRMLIVLDNCEHVVAGVAPFAEKLLTACPGVSVLATSRTRLLVPFERVLPIGGLRATVGPEPGDAVVLFAERAEAAGAANLSGADLERVAAICEALEGSPLAIELAAARLPTLGIAGLEEGLGDHLRLLAGGARATQRHRSLRAACDWSWALLEPEEQRVLRRLSVFVSPFTPRAAADVVQAGSAAEVAEVLATLTEQSLLTPILAEDAPYYRMLDTLRQYGEEQLVAAGELAESRARHAQWCLDTAEAAITSDIGGVRVSWLADNLRAALRWSESAGELASRLAFALGELLFSRGWLAEAQSRFEQAAGAAPSHAASAAALRHASGVAFCRILGEDVVRLRRAAALQDAESPSRSARDLATAAMVGARHTGIFAVRPTREAVDELAALAEDVAGEDAGVRSLLDSVATFRAAEAGTADAALADRAVLLAREVGDQVLECGALDAVYVARVIIGDVRGAVASVRERAAVLDTMPRSPLTAPELIDGLHMVAETYLANGELRDARVWALRFRDLPFMVQQEHVTTNRLMIIDALAGDWDAVLTGSERYRTAWEREDRPRGIILARGAAAVAMVHGMLGHEDAFAQWQAIAESHGLGSDGPERFDRGWPVVFDGVRLLHLGRVDEAVGRMSRKPDELHTSHGATWRAWYAALWAEAAVLGEHPDAEWRLGVAADLVAGNAVAEAILLRAQGLNDGDPEPLRRAAEQFGAVGCHYQRQRTMEMAARPS